MSRRWLAALMAICLVQTGSASHLFGYALEGPVWPTGSTINENLAFTGPSTGSLQDGFTTFNASATDALVLWNQQIDLVHLNAIVTGIPGTKGDGQNTAFFSSNVYGMSFGSGTLAITVFHYDGSTMQEADNVFNSAILWDSYRGPLQYNRKKKQYVIDFHRVALHEFGHTLGLGHPDEAGQSVTAIMNSQVSDLDHLADDDIAGIKSLYGLKITSSLGPWTTIAGNNFSYQITANNSPTSYAASNLPPGLQLNSATGVISGKASQPGSYNANISATGNRGMVSAVLTITVSPPQITSDPTPSILQGHFFDYQITVSTSASSYAVSDLPPEFMLDSVTGRITGTATTSGTFHFRVTAHTAYGDAVLVIEIDVIAPEITSADHTPIVIGSSFSYQITASNQPTSFDATQLPAGLTVNRTTGIISGVPTLSGTYVIKVTAHGQYSDAVGSIQIEVRPDNLNLVPLVATINIAQYGEVYDIATDPQRSRIYVACFNGLLVLDPVTYAVLNFVPVSTGVRRITIAADGSMLWFTSYTTPIGRIDLNALTRMADLPFGDQIQQIKEGLSNRLYVGNFAGIYQMDATTGQIQTVFRTNNASPSGGEVIEMSKDRKSLFAGDSNFDPSFVTKYDVSTATPVEVQRSAAIYGWANQFAVSHDGRFLCLTSETNTPISTPELSAGDLGANYGQFVWDASALYPIFSHDDRLFLEAGLNRQNSQQGGQIAIFDATKRSLFRTILFPNGWNTGPITTDLSDKRLFAVASPYVLVYQLVPSLPPAPPKTLTNVSTRAMVGTADSVEIGGFIIKGTQPKKVYVRAIGPSLANFGVTGAMANPRVEVIDSTGATVLINDNWNEHRTDIVATGFPPSDEHECAAVATFGPGSYTAVLHGVGGTTGVALFELYDLDPQNSKIANISTRGNVGTGDNVMIGGFIIGGSDQSTNVIVRALGPTLTDFGVSGALADPTLELHNGNGAVIAENDNWKSAQQAAIQSSGYAPSKDAEAAILATLQPGNYTAIVRGNNNVSGVALFEVYNLDAN